MRNINITAAEADKKVKTEDGKAFPATDYAYVPDPEAPSTWRLRMTASPGADPDGGIVGAALAALGKGFRGNKVEIPAADLPKVKAKIRAAWLKAHPDKESKDVPEVVRESAIAEHWDEPAMAKPGMDYVPDGITSFEDLFAYRQAQESAYEINELTAAFPQMVSGIMRDPGKPNKASAIGQLALEYASLVAQKTGEITMEAEASEAGKRVRADMRNRLKEIKKQLDELMAWADYDDEDDDNKPVEKPTAHQESAAMEFSESEAGMAIDIAEDDAPPTVADNRSPIKINMRLIRPGAGNLADRNWYPAEVLKRDAHLFEGVKMWPVDHQQDKKSAMNEVAVVEKITGFMDDGAPIARVNIFHPDFAEQVRNRAAAGQLGTLECSILAKGTARPGTVDGKKYNIVEAITEANSVDFVTRAGAGGQALNLAESQKVTQMEDSKPTTPLAETQAVTPAPAPVVIAEGAPAPTPAPVNLAEAEVERLLSASQLPNEIKEIMRERQYKDQAELDAAYAKMVERAKKLIGSGQPFALGAPQSENHKQPMNMAELHKVQDAVNDRFFAGGPK